MFVCQAGTSFTEPQSKRDGAAEVRVEGLLDAVVAEPVRDLDERDRWGAGALADPDRVGDVVDVAVSDEDVGRVDLFGARHGARVIRLQEGVDQHSSRAVRQLETRVAVVANVHL